MRARAAHILLLLTVLAVLASCGRKPRVIPAKQMVRIYSEMFLADQWVRDHADGRKGADTSLLFDPIFRRHGYTFEDYDASVHYYLDRPEQYSDILSQASDGLRRHSEELKAVNEARRVREEELDSYRRLYRPKDFQEDSLRWGALDTLWWKRNDNTKTNN